MNLITPAKRKEAATLVKEGFSVSLASDADTVKAVDNPFPYSTKMLAIATTALAFVYHGITHTHLDSLAHHQRQRLCSTTATSRTVDCRPERRASEEFDS